MKARFFIAVLSFLAALAPSKGSEIFWKGGSSEWTDPQSWESGVVPGPDDVARLAGGISTINLGSGAVVKNISIVGRYIPSEIVGYPGYISRPPFYTLGTGPIGSQTLTLLDDAEIFVSAGYHEGRLTSNATLVLGADGGTGSYRFKSAESPQGDNLYFNGPITGGAGGQEGSKALIAGGDGNYFREIFFNGVISDGGAASLSLKAVASTHFAAKNSYTGTTTLTGSVYLEIADALATSSELILGGDIGTRLYTGNFDQNFGSLSITNLWLIFEGIHTNVTFQDSHLSLWKGILDANSFRIGQNTLRFGSDSSGLTADQLSRIVKSGYTAGIDDDGYIVFTPVAVPEPGGVALLGPGLGVIGIGFSRRKRNL